MKYLILQIFLNFLILFVTVTTCFSSIDALLIEFKKTESKEIRKQLLIKIEEQIATLPFDEAINEWNKFYDTCNKLEDHYCMGFSKYSLAIQFIVNGDFTKSYHALQSSLENYVDAKAKFEEACILSTFGDLHNRLNNYTNSINYFKKCALIFNELNDTINEATTYQNIGAILAENEQFEEAKKYLKDAIHTFNQFNDSANLISCFINMGEIFRKVNNQDSAIHYLQKSVDLTSKFGTIMDSLHSFYFMGKYYLDVEDLELAEPFLSFAYKTASEHPELIPIDEYSEIITSLAEYYEKRGDSNIALFYRNKSDELEIENKIFQSTKELNGIKLLQLEKEKIREKKIRIRTRYISILGFLIAIIIIFTFYRNYKHKQKANKLLTEMDELKTRLYSNITHELRTPLTLILGPLEQMLSSEEKKKPTRKQVKTMRKNANSLLNLVNQMLDLSKIEAKNVKLELVEQDINKFLRSHFANFTSLADQKSIAYKYSSLKESNVQIFDSNKLEKIINNLVSNAIKFTPKNGEINCFTDFPTKNTLKIIVEDSGKGMPKEELKNIFDRYHQVKNNDTINSVGTGIGLSLTRELVLLMHGEIKVESEPGKGSKFTVTLPLGTSHLTNEEFNLLSNNSTFAKTSVISEPIEVEKECVNEEDSKKSNNGFPQVLVAEDNPDIREFIIENLKDCYAIEEAENGKIALDKAIENIPDLVLTDVVMPEMDGIEFCKQLKSDIKTSHIPVIMLTGKSSIDDRMTGLDMGADAYLTKPFNIKELRLRVKKLIEQRQKLRERFTKNLNLEPKDIAVTSADEMFLNKAMEIIEKNMGNSDFEVRQFQEDIFMSRMQLFRKIKALTNQTPGEFIRTIRLKRAAHLLDNKFGNIAQITYEVGFNNPSYFAKCFKDLFGVLPSEYKKTE